MKKHEYLRDPEVAAFVEWMGANLGADSTRGHGYVLPREQRLWFRNLADAFALYAWRFNFLRLDGRRCSGMSFAESKAVLDVLQAQLRTALEAGDDALVRDAAVEVVRWGGVAPHNEEWLRVNKNGLAALIGRVRVAIGQQDDAADFCPGLRFNAGMTKVYSLLVDYFVIYDSRVAAALAWFVAAWATETGRGVVPALLQFVCMDAKEAPNAARRKLRNPRTDTLQFPPLRNDPYAHMRWNLRASWIVEQLLQTQRGTPFGTGPDASRKLEAALFMWGYDLAEPAPAPVLGAA
ncbi:hypothetical protein AB4Z32_18485 [Massilia sp. 2TAF26]|uniref:hypothetical protein n=1 Tax=Massilia sp. 2TAF26 TaxID=3233012 RepID=UPI003F9D196D